MRGYWLRLCVYFSLVAEWVKTSGCGKGGQKQWYPNDPQRLSSNILIRTVLQTYRQREWVLSEGVHIFKKTHILKATFNLLLTSLRISESRSYNVSHGFCLLISFFHFHSTHSLWPWEYIFLEFAVHYCCPIIQKQSLARLASHCDRIKALKCYKLLRLECNILGPC